jgi:hypothetical protein
MNRVPLLADQVRSNSVQHCRSQKLAYKDVEQCTHICIPRYVGAPLCSERRSSGSTRLLRWYREVPHEYTLQWKSRIYTFVVEFIARVAFPTFYG